MEVDPWEEKVAFVRRYYEDKGYRVHSGLQFGCELVLYADDPQRVHSDFCIHVVRDGTTPQILCEMLVPNSCSYQKYLLLFFQMTFWIGDPFRHSSGQCLTCTRL